MKKRALFIIALSILAIATMFISGIVAQIIINSRAWQAAGSNYSAPPSLPVIQLEAIIKALLTFPEGIMAIGTVLGAVVLLCVFGLRLGWGKRGTSDQDRNLTISYDGTYGTAGFMLRTHPILSIIVADKILFADRNAAKMYGAANSLNSESVIGWHAIRSDADGQIYMYRQCIWLTMDLGHDDLMDLLRGCITEYTRGRNYLNSVSDDPNPCA